MTVHRPSAAEPIDPISQRHQAPSLETWRGESLIARAIRTLLIPAMGVKGGLRDTERYARTIQASRAVGEAPLPARLSRRYQCDKRVMAGGEAWSLQPAQGPVRHTVVYLHGGAYVSPMMPLQWNLVEGLLRPGDVRVIVPHYPLAPEHDWRSAYAMMTALYETLLRETDPETITLCGDSAGGGFALGLAQLLRDKGAALPGRLVLFSPWLDLQQDRQGQDVFDARDPILARPALIWAAQRWAGPTDRRDPRLSPIYGDLQGLPPILAFSGDADLLHTDALALFERVKHQPVSLRLVVGLNMTHAWSVLATPDAKRLFSEVARFVGGPHSAGR